MEIHEKILVCLYEFRNDSDYHDLFNEFEQGDYEVIWDRVNSLCNEKLIETQLDVYIGWSGPTKPKHNLFARITKQGIEHVKINIINKKQKDREERKRFLITTVISIAFLLAAAYGIYQTNRTNKFERDNLIINQENDSLRNVNNKLDEELKFINLEFSKLKSDTSKLKLK